MRKSYLSLAVFFASSLMLAQPLAARADATTETPKEGPCKQIKEACEGAGFVKGQWKAGTGLWDDCINPVMQSKSQPASAKKPLPSIQNQADLVSQCHAKRPKFGMGKIH